MNNYYSEMGIKREKTTLQLNKNYTEQHEPYQRNTGMV